MKKKAIFLICLIVILLTGCNTTENSPVENLVENTTTPVIDDLDTTPPTINLSQTQITLLLEENVDFSLFASAFDDRDGDISKSIVVDETGFNPDAAGKYIVRYKVSDNSNNQARAAITVVVEIPIREDVDVRNAKWGEDASTVKKYEMGKFIDERDGIILCSDKLSGSDAKIFYYFSENNELYKILYFFDESHTNTQFYISEYETFKTVLTEKYGKAYSDNIVKTDILADYADTSTALTLGYVTYVTQWENDRTNIILGMLSDNGEIQTGITFESKDIEITVDTSGW